MLAIHIPQVKCVASLGCAQGDFQGNSSALKRSRRNVSFKYAWQRPRRLLLQVSAMMPMGSAASATCETQQQTIQHQSAVISKIAPSPKKEDFVPKIDDGGPGGGPGGGDDGGGGGGGGGGGPGGFFYWGLLALVGLLKNDDDEEDNQSNGRGRRMRQRNY